MTGKELMIAIVASGLVGGAAGAAAGVFSAPKDDPASRQPSPELLARLTTTENELAKAKTALEASTRSMHELQERVTAAELKAAKQEAMPQLVNVGGRPIRLGGRHGAAAAAPATGENGDEPQIDVGTVELGDEFGKQLGAQLGKALEGMGGEIGAAGGQFEAFRNGLELRKLPEDKRWEKAKDDLGLSWNQVEDLKKAVADRDAAMKEADVVEKKDGPDGGRITISRPDPGKVAHAQADYHDRVNAALNDDQKKKDWQSKGYDNAFGSSPFSGGGGMVMAIDVSTDKKDEKKDPK